MYIARTMRLRTRAAIAGLTLAVIFQQAAASILTVGPGRMYKNPKAAAAAAHRGDTIQIYPGTYWGAVWYPKDLTIVGMGAGATITGPVLMGKGLFDIEGDNATIKNLTFTGAKASAGNGSGIRLDGTNLTVLNSKFTYNQDGILAGDNSASTITIKNSTFYHNGACVSACAHGVYVGNIAMLDIENSTFNATQKGHSIKSRARVTNILNNKITDGPNGTSSYLIDVAKGGAVTITGNTLEKGPKASNATYAITIGEEVPYLAQGPMLIANNTYQNDKQSKGVFVRNVSGYTGLVLSGNTLLGFSTTMLEGKGTISANTASALTAALTAPLDASLTAFAAPMQFAAADAAPSVPEESTLALFATVLAGMMGLGRRRRTGAPAG
jgi:hypothetical protein